MTTTSINPATGLPINDADNGNCVDIGGNVFGTDNSDFSDTQAVILSLYLMILIGGLIFLAVE